MSENPDGNDPRLTFFVKNRSTVLMSFLWVFLTVWLSVSEMPVLQQARMSLEALVSDHRVVVNHKPWVSTTAEIVIIDIDAKSLEAEGPWPWPGSKMAKLSNKLTHYGVALTAFDLVFPTPTPNSAQAVLNYYQKSDSPNPALVSLLSDLVKKFDLDRYFAQGLRHQDVVLGFEFQGGLRTSQGVLPLALPLKSPAHLRHLRHESSYFGNLATLQQAAPQGGFINFDPDWDGIVRRAPLVVRYGQELYASLALQCVRMKLLNQSVTLDVPKDNAEHLRALILDELRLPVNVKGDLFLSFRGPPGSFPSFSATDLLRDKILPKQLEGKIVIVGSSAAHIRPRIHTLAGRNFTSAEVHAHIVSSLLSQQILSKPRGVRSFDAFLLLGAGCILALLLPLLRTRHVVSVCTLVLLSWILYNLFWYSIYLIITSLVIPVIMVIGLATLNTFAQHEPSKRRVRYLWLLVRELTTRSKTLRGNMPTYAAALEDQATVLYVDLAQFAEISDSLEPPRLTKLISLIASSAIELVYKHEGQLPLYVGHMLMATWSTDNLAHARHAINTALGIIEAVDQLAPKLLQQGLPKVRVNIGIASGPVKVRKMGLKALLLSGPAIEQANRLVRLAPFYDVRCVVDESIQKHCVDFVYRKLDRLESGDSPKNAWLFEPLSVREDLSLLHYYELQKHHETLELLAGQNLSGAHKIFARLRQLVPQRRLYQLYWERLNELVAEENPSWSGSLNRRKRS